MIESVFYESSGHRIEVRRIPGPYWLWFRGVDNDVSYDGPLEYHGLHTSLVACLVDATYELHVDADYELQVTEWVVSKDQHTPVVAQ